MIIILCFIVVSSGVVFVMVNFTKCYEKKINGAVFGFCLWV